MIFFRNLALVLGLIFSFTANAQINKRVFYTSATSSGQINTSNILDVCAGQTITFADSSISTPPVNAWQWRINNVTPTTLFNTRSATVTYNNVGLDTVFLRVNNVNSSDSLYFLVRVNAVPVAAFTFNNNVCAGSNVTFNNTSTGVGSLTYLWTFGTGVGAPPNSSNTSPIVTFNPNNGSGSTIYNVSLVVTSSNGCANNFNQPITIRLLPNIDFSDSNVFASPPYSNCLAGPSVLNPTFRLTLNNNLTNQSHISGYSFNWGVGGTVNYTSPLSKATNIYNVLGKFNLSITANGTNGCISNREYLVANQSNPAVGITSNGNTQGCAPMLLPFILGGYTNNSPGTYYIFDPDDGSPTTRLESITNDTIWHLYTKTSCGRPGNQFVPKITAYNVCDSTTASVTNVKIWIKPKAKFFVADTVICINQTITIQDSTTRGAHGNSCSNTTIYDWTFQGATPNSSSTQGPHTLIYSNPGLYKITLRVSNPCGVDSMVKWICVQPQPTSSFNYNWSSSSRCSPSVISFNNTSNTLTSCGNTAYSWTVSPNGGTSFISGTNTNSLNPQIQFLNSGTYNVRLTVANRCNIVYRDTVIIVKGPPIVQLPNEKNYCDTLTIAFNASNTSHNPNYISNGGTISSYAWSITPTNYFFVGGTNASSQYPMIRFTQPGTYKVKVEVVNECGFSADSQIVNILSPVGVPIVRDTFSCGPSTFNLTGLLGTNGNTLRWYGDSTTSTVINTGLNFNTSIISTSRSFFVSTYNTVTGCESYRVRLHILIRTMPSSPFGSKQTRCGPASLNLTATVGANGNKLKWYTTPSGGSPIFIGNPFVTPVLTSTTVYYVSSYDSIYGCESIARFADTVVINQLPVVSAGNDTSFCNLPGSVNLFATPTGGTWSGPGVNATGVFTPINVGIGVYDIIYSYTNPITTCMNKDTVKVSVVGATIPNAGTDTSLCKTSSVFTLQGSPSGGTWSGSPNVTSLGVFNPTTAGTYRLIYATGSGSCLARDTLEVIVKALPQPNFNLVNGICPNQSLALSASNGNSTSIISYRWFINATKSFPVNIVADSSQAITSISFPDNQTTDTILYRVKLRLISSDGCIDSVTKNIILNKRPNSQFSAIGSGCGPSLISVINTSTNNPNSWNWFSSPSTGVIFTPSPTVMSPNILLPINNTSSTINYKLYLNATTNGIGANCTDLDSITIPLYPKPLVGFTNNLDSGCTPLILSFDNKSDPKNNQSQSSMSFIWKLNNQQISNDSVPINLSLSNNLQRDSTINIKLIGSTINGCSDSLEKNVTIFPDAKASFSFGSTSSCAPFSIGSSNININPYPLVNSSYSWQYLNPITKAILVSTSGNTPPNYVINNPNDSVLLRLVAIALKGCKSDTFEQVFRTISNPVAEFALSDSVGCSGISINFTNQSSSGVILNWLFSNGFQSGASNPTISFTSSSNSNDTLHWARLIITAGGSGCKDSITKFVRILPRPLSSINSINNQYCSNQIISLNANSSAKQPANYAWSKTGVPSVNLVDTNLNIVRLILPDNQGLFDSTFSLKLRTTSADGCFADTVIGITTLRRPFNEFTLPFNLCYSGNVIPINQTSNISTNQLTWLWSSVPSVISITTVTDKEPVFSLPANNSADSVIYYVRLITDRLGLGCKDTLVKPIIVYPKPLPSFTTSKDSSCSPHVVGFDNKSIAKNGESFESMNFKWFINGTLATQDSVLQNQTFVNATQKDSIVSIKLKVTSKHGCNDSLTKDLVIHPNAKSQFTTTRTLSCAPFIIDSTVINTNVYPNANSAYYWFINDTLVGNSINFIGYTILKPDDSVMVKLVTTGLYGCSSDTLSRVFKTIPNPTPNFVLSDTTGCMPLNIQMTNTSNPVSGLTYEWKVGLDTSTIKNPIFNVKNYGISDTVVLARLIVIAGNTGCKDSIEKPIIIKPLPRPDFNFFTTSNCFPSPIIISNSSSTQPSIKTGSYKWRAYGQGLVVSNDSSNSAIQINYPDNQTGISKNVIVSLSIASDFGCIDSITKTTFISTRPIANFVSNRIKTCAFDTLGITNMSNYATNYQWSSIQNGLSISNPNIENPNIQGLNFSNTIDSIYSLKLVAINSFGCKDSTAKPITVNPNPSTTITLNKSSGCAPLLVSFNQLTISKLGSSYSWLLEKGINGTGDSISHNFIGSEMSDTVYLVKLVTTTIDGCTDTSLTSITAKAGAKADISLSDSIFCMNQNFSSIFINNLSYGSVDTFFYNFGDTTYLVTDSDSSFYHEYFNEGKYKLILKATNVCKTSYDSTEFKILKKPTPRFSLSDSIGCSPLKVQFNNLTNSFDANYFWNFGNGITSDSKHPDTITFYQSKFFDTTYIVRLNATNFCGTESVEDTVRVLPVPVANFIMSTDSGCSPLPVSFLNTTTGLPSYIKWDFSNGDTSKRYNPYPTTFRTEDSTTIYRIKLIASNLCGIDSITKSVKVEPNTVRAFFTTSGTTGCAPFTVNFNNLSVGGTYVGWDFGNGQTSSNNNPQITYQNSGLFTAYLYVNNGCSYDTAKVIINVLKVPEFSITTSQKIACMREPILFSANLLDSGSIVWHITETDSFEQKSLVYNYTTEGLKPFFARLKSSINFCSKTIFDTIKINPLPQINLNINASNQCFYKSFIFNNNGSTLTNVFYTWVLSDGNSYTGNSLTHQFNSSGTYQVKLKGINNYGCIDSSQTSVIAYPKPTAKFDYNPKDTCVGPVTVAFSNQSQGAAAYLWDFGNNLTSQLTNPNTTYTGVGTYQIALIASNQYGCFDTSLAEYHVYNTPKSDFTFSANNGCEPLVIEFQNTSEHGNSWLWDFGDGTYSNQKSPKHIYLKSGTYDVRLTAIEGGICRDSITMSKLIVVHPKPTSNFSAILDSTIRPYSVIIFTNQSFGAVKYLWLFDDNTTSTEQNPKHKFNIWGEHLVKLIVYTDKNCADTIESWVYVPEYKKGLFVPNAFTPGYGQPEVQIFKPIGIELKNYHVQVLNKWGELMWESDKIDEYGRPTEGWDGTDKNGIPCIQGAYVWIIKAQHTDGVDWEGMVYPTGSRKPVTSGNVTLIR